MEPTQASSIAREILRTHELGDWSFAYDRALQRTGACFYRRRVITLSRAFVKRNAETVVRDTILHEVSHALAWERDGATGHGASWKKWCKVTGAKARRCFDEEEVTMPAARYQCTVLATEAAWTRGSGANLQMGVARIRRGVGEVFGRHRVTRKLRWAVGVGLVEVLDTRTGQLVEV